MNAPEWSRFIAFLIWGLGTFMLATYVLAGRLSDWRQREDARSRREVYEAAGLWIVSLATTTSVVLVLFNPPGGLRSLMTAISLGAFTYVVAIMAVDTYRGRQK